MPPTRSRAGSTLGHRLTDTAAAASGRTHHAARYGAEMETAWLFDTLTVTLARIDFLDPELAEAADTRERGVRLEIRPTTWESIGTIYASPSLALDPAVCRIDLLESAPEAVDRMHWHPTMDAGEPGDRTFDDAIPADPLRWLDQQLARVDLMLERAGVDDTRRHSRAVRDIADQRHEIVQAARIGLEWAREPWPEVQHDERGMAIHA